MKSPWLRIALAVLCFGAIAFEVWHFRSSPQSARQISASAEQENKQDFVLLPASELVTFAETYARLRPHPSLHIKSWEPTLGDMEDAEANLPQISTLTRRNLGASSHIDAHQYLRQYLAVEMDGKNLLFVNGLCPILYKRNDDWRKRLIVVDDGGACHWQAIYDPNAHRFSDFSVNGVG